MVVYPDLAFFMGLALHGGNLYLYLKFHPLSRPRWSQILFLLFSSLFQIQITKNVLFGERI